MCEKPVLEGGRCPVEVAVEVIGGKWKTVILFHLIRNNTMRFNALKRTMPDITQRMLTKQLRELEASGIVHREIYQEIPPKVEYSITEFGQTLVPILESLYDWGASYIQQEKAAQEAQGRCE
ncbi:MAG: winged helix-turn-helix transcriptional regulator [Pontibacterium sp.]